MKRLAARSVGLRCAELLEAVEDQIEAELEVRLVRHNVLPGSVGDAGLHYPAQHLGEVRVFVGGDPGLERCRHVVLFLRVEWPADLVEREAIEVAVDRELRLVRQLDREARPSKRSDHRVCVSEPHATGRHSRLDQGGRPRVTQQHFVSRPRRFPQGHPPVRLVGRYRELAYDHFDDAVHNVVLVGDVVVERHRLDPELLAEPAHGKRLEAVLIG